MRGGLVTLSLVNSYTSRSGFRQTFTNPDQCKWRIRSRLFKISTNPFTCQRLLFSSYNKRQSSFCVLFAPAIHSNLYCSFLFSFFCLQISVVRVPGRLTLKSRYSLGQSIKEAFSSRNPPLMILVAQNIQTFGNTTTTFVFFIQETVQQDFRPLFCSSFESTYATPGVWYLREIDSTVYRSRGVMFWRILFLPNSTPRGLTREVRFSSFKFK